MGEATSVWGDDGSLTIIQSETNIYGDELTIIQDTDMGIIQY